MLVRRIFWTLVTVIVGRCKGQFLYSKFPSGCSLNMYVNLLSKHLFCIASIVLILILLSPYMVLQLYIQRRYCCSHLPQSTVQHGMLQCTENESYILYYFYKLGDVEYLFTLEAFRTKRRVS